MAKKPASPSEERPNDKCGAPATLMPRGKRRLFILLSLALPLLALLTCEAALRLGGYGGYPPAVRPVGTTAGRTLLITDTTGAASYFDSSKTGPGSLNQFSFFDPKPPNTIRIVLAGGSAIKGFPQPMGFAPSAFLREMLSDTWPDRNVEVITLRTTAVASLPVLGILKEMLDYEPDLVVIYTGHNEFFGAYGVASMHHAARSPMALKLQRGYGSTAIGQFLATLRRSRIPETGKAMMEAVVRETYIAPDSPLRAAAARNLYSHITGMIERCQARSIPTIVCTLASNERGLAPIGECDVSRLTADERARLARLLQRGSGAVSTDVAAAIDDLEAALRIDPNHARIHFHLGRAYESVGDAPTAARHYRTALDLDPMPWRAPSASMDAIQRAARERGAVLCDVQQAFRDASPLGAVGWELMDDHVHPTLKGQWLLAQSIVTTLTSLPGKLNVTRSARKALPDFGDYARRLGDNSYDRFGVVASLYKVFDVPFMRQADPAAFARIRDQRDDLLASMNPILREQARNWADPKTHSGFKIPLSGMVARVKMSQGNLVEAERLFAAARNHVPTYTGPYFEYTCFALACRQQNIGSLTPADQELARDTIERIALFLRYADASSGQPERFMGRLHQILDEHQAAIPHLLAARDKLTGDDLVKADLALVASYAKTDNFHAARRVLEEGIQQGGRSAQVYRRLLAKMPAE